MLAPKGVSVTVVVPEGGNAARRLRAGGVDVVTMPLHRARATLRPRPLLSLLRHLPEEVAALRAVIRNRAIDVVQVEGLVNPHAAIAAVARATSDHLATPRYAAADVRAETDDAARCPSLRRRHEHGSGRRASPSRRGGTWRPASPVLSAGRPRRVPARERRRRCGTGVVRLRSRGPRTGQRRKPQSPEGPRVPATGPRASSGAMAMRVKALVVGASHETHVAYERQLYALCRRLGLRVGSDVVFAGALDDVRQALAAGDIFVLSSVPRSEGIPTAAEEAMMMSRPVIATDVGGVSELVQDGVTGFVVRPLDPQALADAVHRTGDSGSRAAMGARARARAVNLCSTRQCAQVHLEAYERALEHGASRRNRTHPVRDHLWEMGCAETADEHRRDHRLEWSDRLRGGDPLRGARARRGRARQRHAARLLRRRSLDDVESEPRPGAAGGELLPSRPRCARPGGDAAPLPPLRPGDRARDPYRRAAVTRLGRTRAVHRLRHQCRRHAESSRGYPFARPGGGVRLHLDEQGVRRPSECAPAR